ncbi:YifB family Mg chelatase-like AAA ATPase [Candidatus Margulisiibacteriota bacterium]
MFVRIKSAALQGITAFEIIVEVDAHKGMPGETIVGLPDAVIKESRNRIKAAIKNSGFEFTLNSYTINLAPAELRKEGPLLDLAIAVGVLQATKQITIDQESMFVGELSLSGEIKPIRGIVSICDLVKEKKIKRIFIPFENYSEAALIKGIEIIPVKRLENICEHYANNYEFKPFKITKKSEPYSQIDFNEVKGQLTAKRALEIAAAGNHNILFIGPPGSGKTMLLKRLPTILPDMTEKQAIETYKIQSITQSSSPSANFFNMQRPFRSPHHTISYAGMVGGGQNPRPGEISLAHNGVLFLDELPEFNRNVIEVLRQPLEDGRITISRANFIIEYPCNFILASSMNPCKCGHKNDPHIKCTCHKKYIRRYWSKISGPILDRIDLIVDVPRLKRDELFSKNDPKTNPYTSEKMRARIANARKEQAKRFDSPKTNSEITARDIQKHCPVIPAIQEFLGNAIDRGKLTGRSFDKVLKVARTIADLEKAKDIALNHICEAMQYRRNSLE